MQVIIVLTDVGTRNLNQPRLKFKEVNFNDAMSKGFEAIGIVYTSMDIKQLN